ncbi:MAG: MmcB family DNA repair protein [Phyllobacteriaceae bacterium]|nr:MmcB family DNA repair protein [Phyllobacteriaceae bacterium]
MPIVQIAGNNPLTDGRQSPTALMIQRGMIRHLEHAGNAVLAEFPLANGRRADLLCLDRKGRFTLIEIKSSIEDYKVDHKWPEYAGFCDYFAFATWHGVPLEIFPQTEGLYVADAHFAELLREPVEQAMHSASRKALTLRFARLAAQRAERIARFAEANDLAFDRHAEGEATD